MTECPMTRARAGWTKATVCSVVGVCCAGTFGCGGPLDVGENRRELLPVGPDNSMILLNDSVYDNWHGEYASLFQHAGGPPVLGVVVSTGGKWIDLDSNYAGWQELAATARDSGLPDLGEVVRSPSAQLERPADDSIEATSPNDSLGARFIVAESLRIFSATSQPVVIAVGGRLTDVADAYLIDPSVVERVVVVASVGSGFDADGASAEVGRPNGEMDPWAGEVVIRKFRYIQIAAHYDQTADVPATHLDELAVNPLREWIAAKISRIDANPLASDQVSVLAVGLTGFAREVHRVSPGAPIADVPTLEADLDGESLLVTSVDGAAATERFGRLLRELR